MTYIIVIAVNVWRFCDAYDILYICHLRRSDEAGVTWNCIWKTTVEEWTSRPGYVFLLTGTKPKDVFFRTAFHLLMMYFAGFVGFPLLQMSRWLDGPCGDSAWRLSCVYGGQWKRAFRVNTRVIHFAVLYRPVRSYRPVCVRVFYTCNHRIWRTRYLSQFFFCFAL